MKRIAFISDIHGNIEALEAVLNDIEKKNIEEIYCLGDLVGYGPEPDEVIKKIREKNIISVKGNYDDAVGNEKSDCGCSYSPGRETEIGNESLNWTIKNVTNENKEFLNSLPETYNFEIEGIKVLLVHGSPLNPLFEYLHSRTSSDRLKKVVESTDAEIIICGHTHHMLAKHLSGKSLLNPGSVGRTKDGFSGGASYLIVEFDRGVYSYSFEIVKYDVKTTIEKIIKAGLPEELAIILALGETFNMRNSEKKKNNMFYI
ncbi:metallophosphoesterase family protein [Thermosipho ferrireducens]|uniref:Phosphoesterase n=1 Tax=Thermosipho ferrireducens TaxID=2571116 RepID=A0ABX7S4V9_9BACT|nr:metallophosphoesterase family protein [Thermosipho ferrireducens]QTA37507.1 metallophosphoesterase family protein [Thermosipho ferrireducens]